MIVKTKQDLESALKNKVEYFEVEGELAEQLKKGQKITTLSKVALSVLTASIAGIALAPATGGVSGVMGLTTATAIATLTGLEIAVIMTVAFVGVRMLMALYKDYEVEYEYEIDPKGGKSKLKCTKKEM